MPKAKELPESFSGIKFNNARFFTEMRKEHPGYPDRLNDMLPSHKFNRYLNVIAEHQGITTEQLVDYGLKSNNQACASQYLNELLIPLGWVIAKFPAHGRFKSWLWYLMPVKRALRLEIDKRLRKKIFRLLVAANDE